MLALYHNDMSSCAQKVRLMLAEKGLEWESRHLDLRAGEHQQDWYVKLNPRAVVPTLIDGDIVVPESNVINEYLDERFPDRPIKPADPFGRAKMRLWTKQLDEGVHDAGIAILSFGVAFRHQYITRGEAGNRCWKVSPILRSASAGAMSSRRDSLAILQDCHRTAADALSRHGQCARRSRLARRRQLFNRRRCVHALCGAAGASRRAGPARFHARAPPTGIAGSRPGRASRLGS